MFKERSIQKYITPNKCEFPMFVKYLVKLENQEKNLLLLFIYPFLEVWPSILARISFSLFCNTFISFHTEGFFVLSIRLNVLCQPSVKQSVRGNCSRTVLQAFHIETGKRGSLLLQVLLVDLPSKVDPQSNLVNLSRPLCFAGKIEFQGIIMAKNNKNTGDGSYSLICTTT